MDSDNDKSTDIVVKILESMLQTAKDGSLWKYGRLEWSNDNLPNGYRFVCGIKQKRQRKQKGSGDGKG